MSQSFSPRAILITGTSSGIGRALASADAAPGRILCRHGRDAGRLDAVAADCARAGASTATAMLAVTDRAAMARWTAGVDRSTPLDLVSANAGISGGNQAGPARARTIFRVNAEGVLNTVEPVLAPIIARGRGRIALMSACRLSRHADRTRLCVEQGGYPELWRRPARRAAADGGRGFGHLPRVHGHAAHRGQPLPDAAADGAGTGGRDHPEAARAASG